MFHTNRFARGLLMVFLLTGLFAGLVGPRLLNVGAAPQVMQVTTHIVISQVYGGGGNTGAPYTNDYVELFNPSDAAIPMGGWSIQYASATGSFANVANLSGSLAPGQYYLVQLGGGATGSPLPAPDAVGTTAMGATNGKVALANIITDLSCDGSSTPCDPANIIDLVGYGNATFYEGSAAAPAPSNTTADLRNVSGCNDTDNNNANFTAGAPMPRNTTSPVTVCSTVFTATASAANLTATSSAATASAANLTGTASAANLTATASAANLTGTSAALTGTPTVTSTATATLTSGPASALDVLINEVAWMGTSSTRSTDEWIELYNTRTSVENLNGWRLTVDNGTTETDLIVFDGDDTIPAGGYFLLARPSGGSCVNTATPPAYDINIFNDVVEDACFSTQLTNSPGQIMRLYDAVNTLIDTANSDGGSWPAGSSSSYSSMERRGKILDGTGAWVTYGGTPFAHNRDSALVRGTPKQANWFTTITPTPTRTKAPPTKRPTARPLPPVGRPILNEFLPRPGFDWNQDGKIDVFDEFIEIINVGPVSININGWRLDDEEGLGSNPFTLPSITLQPGQRVVFYGSETNILLSDGGDSVRLLNASGTIMDAYTYKVAKVPDESWCRLPDGYGSSWYDDCTPTVGMPNSREGQVPSMPPGTGLQPAICQLPDTLPDDVFLAECNAYGTNMWSTMFWDEDGWQGDRIVPDNESKSESFVE